MPTYLTWKMLFSKIVEVERFHSIIHSFTGSLFVRHLELLGVGGGGVGREIPSEKVRDAHRKI